MTFYQKVLLNLPDGHTVFSLVLHLHSFHYATVKTNIGDQNAREVVIFPVIYMYQCGNQMR